ncbi:uncharacterized protein STEHIDRAFT_109014 [Stereum hirsutum FP-91666 SS1]|uniref:uncharacterized protein n=1 Tax=Stereum hirsutum (strain FP-91666) TaxID=721885 RepID=UPI000440CFF2|nr:uncharacterized protein STEHIDRAFT_109014 [Stereum hirsutum FP-91666 SS1]EIM90542.1 hypothetical protein STEHIDRAFT_109014 [Stereum hirsutum FP-91666 SS1]
MALASNVPSPQRKALEECTPNNTQLSTPRKSNSPSRSCGRHSCSWHTITASTCTLSSGPGPLSNKENEPHTRRYYWPGLSEGSYHTEDADYSPRTSLLSDDEDHAVTSDASRVLTDTNDAEDNTDGYEADGEGDNVRRTIEPCTHVKMCGTKKDDAGYEAGDEDELLGEIVAYICRTSKSPSTAQAIGGVFVKSELSPVCTHYMSPIEGENAKVERSVNDAKVERSVD